MSHVVIARAFWCAAFLLSCEWAAIAVAAEPLVIGRQVEDSIVSDTSQRIVAEAFARAQIPVEFRRLPLARAVAAANDGETDGELHRIIEIAAKYPNLVVVPTSINRVDIAMYGASSSIATLTRAQVFNMSVAFPRGTLSLIKHSEGMQRTEATTRAGAIEMLVNGRVDLMLGSYVDIEPRVADGSLAGIHVWPHVWAREELYLMLNQRHSALVPRIDAALRRMKQDGTLERYYADGLRSLKIRPLPFEPARAPKPIGR